MRKKNDSMVQKEEERGRKEEGRRRKGKDEIKEISEFSIETSSLNSISLISPNH